MHHTRARSAGKRACFFPQPVRPAEQRARPPKILRGTEKSARVFLANTCPGSRTRALAEKTRALDIDCTRTARERARSKPGVRVSIPDARVPEKYTRV
jgi:hypothetical protein